MTKTDASVTVLFADISGSTQLYEKLGDAAAHEIASNCMQVLRQVTEEFDGEVIKTIGDEVMCAFANPSLAGRAAMKMQATVSLQNLGTDAHLRIRTGFHAGPAIRQDGDLFGDAVNTAAHIAAQAKALQILTSKDTVNLLPPELQASTRFVDSTNFKGTTQAIEIHELVWGEADDLTITNGLTMRQAPKARCLKIRYGEKLLELDDQRPVLTIGRGSQNQLVVADTSVSRLHARIEYRRGQFFLVEQSTNGSHVRLGKGKSVFVHRDQVPLQGSGTISLGNEPATAESALIHFDCAEESNPRR